MKYLITFFLLLSFCELNSQDLPSREIFTPSGLMILDSENSDNNIKGNTYLIENGFAKAIVNTINNKIYNLSKANFDVKNGKFIVKTSKNKVLVIDDSKINFITIDNKKFKRIDNKYFEILSKGNLSIYKQYYLTIIEGAKDPLSKSKITDDKYIVKSKYYLMTSYELKKVKNNKRTIFKLFKDSHKKQMKTYIKENSLSYKKDKDLKKILNYYNSI